MAQRFCGVIPGHQPHDDCGGYPPSAVGHLEIEPREDVIVVATPAGGVAIAPKGTPVPVKDWDGTWPDGWHALGSTEG